MPYVIIKRAIERRESLSAKYNDYVRFFSPHVLGDDWQGEKAVISYQYGGGRRGGLPHAGDWGLFHLVGLRDLTPNADKWRAGPRGTMPLHLLKTIDIQV